MDGAGPVAPAAVGGAARVSDLADQILGGMLVWCSAQKVDTKKTKETGQQYTAKSWEPVPASAYARYGLEPPVGTYDPDGVVSTEDQYWQAQAATALAREGARFVAFTVSKTALDVVGLSFGYILAPATKAAR